MSFRQNTRPVHDPAEDELKDFAVGLVGFVAFLVVVAGIVLMLAGVSA